MTESETNANQGLFRESSGEAFFFVDELHFGNSAARLRRRNHNPSKWFRGIFRLNNG